MKSHCYPCIAFQLDTPIAARVSGHLIPGDSPARIEPRQRNHPILMFERAGEEFPIGRMEIKELSGLKRHVGGANASPSDGKEQQADSSSSSSSTGLASGEDGAEAKPPAAIEPTFGGSRCKLFELAELADCLVFLAYQLQPEQDEPSVWLYCTKSGRWHRLADSFTKYFRMMLVHLGLPAWQKCAAGLQLPTWLEQVYLLVGPHLLQSTSSPSVAPTVSVSLWTDGPTNLIDPAIFRARENPGAKQKPSNAAGTSSGNPRKKSSCH